MNNLSQQEYFTIFAKECGEELELTKAKNKDYSGNAFAFKNFDLIEALTQGSTSTEMGIIVRLTDKLQRITNLLSAEAAVSDEKITDTLRDLSVYAKILRIYIMTKHRNEIPK